MKKKVMLLTTLIVSMLSASSQEVLTLNDAVKIGLENGYSVVIARNQYNIAANNNTYGNAGFLPRIDANAGGSFRSLDGNNKLRSGGTSTYDSPSTLNATAGLSLSWTLFDGMNMFITKDQLDLLQKQGDAGLRANMERSAAQIISTYNAIMQQKQLIKVFEETMNVSKQRVTIAQTAKNIGSGSDVTLLKSEVDYKTDSSNLVNQLLTLSNLKADLNQLLGRSPEISFDVQDLPMAYGSIVYADIVAKALEQNPDLIRAKQELSYQQLNIKKAKSESLPTINLNSGYSYNHNNFGSGQFKSQYSYGPTVGVTANIRLFNGFNTKRAIRNAELQANNSEVSLRQQEQELRTIILKTYNEYSTAMSIVEIEKKSLELAQKNLTIALKAYSQGSISDIDMRETQKSYVDVSYRLINAQISLKDTEIELHRLSGTLTVAE